MNPVKNKMTFVKAGLAHEKTIFFWLSEPHMMAFWDNSQEHKDDIANFIHGRKQHYFSGETKYFIGLMENIPYCFLLTEKLQSMQKLSNIQRHHLSVSGNTISLDFGIGNKDYLGQGLAHQTLQAFIKYYHDFVDDQADTFFIDPDKNNPRAKHVYSKAGFKLVGEYSPQEGAFIGNTSLLMVKKLPARPPT